MTQLEITQGFTARNDVNFIAVIEAILREPQNGGFFKHEVKMPTGKKVTYQLSWAVDMSSLHAKYRYQKHFGMPPPPWTQFIHPRHAGQVCNLAMAGNKELPPANPMDSHWGGSA